MSDRGPKATSAHVVKDGVPAGALPLRAKVRLVVLQAGLITLAALAGAVLILQVAVFRNTFADDLGALTAIMASHVAPALERGDSAAAVESLAALRSKPGIVSATIVAPDGRPLARFGREETPQTLAEFQTNHKTTADGKHWLRSEPITAGGKGFGLLHLRADYAVQRDELIRASLGIITGFLVICAFILVVLTARLHSLITQPICQLADAAWDVARRKDYSVRVRKLVNDELGQLADAFNQMLGEIQEQDSALHTARQKLEQQLRALADSEARFRGVVENLGEALLLVGLRGEAVFMNPRFTALLGWTEEDLQGRDALKLLMPETDRNGPLLARTQPEESGSGLEVPLQRRDGTWIWAEVHASQMRGPDGTIVGTLAAILDVTTRHRAAENLEELNKQLVEASRHAGMAEVATGVLHNVGNVLNSVNLAATASLEKLRASKVANLAKAADLLTSRNGDLATWLSSDPQGQRLPAYLVRLSEHLAAENQELIVDLDQLAKNVEHIKEIVALQQSNACMSGVIETLSAEQLVEDAVRMNMAKVNSQGIEVSRHYTPAPLVSVDKHKVIQIVINLIRNAKHALEEVSRPDKRITVRIARAGEEFVNVTISDNGVGIAPENLTRIFRHGFTTKKARPRFWPAQCRACRERNGRLALRWQRRPWHRRHLHPFTTNCPYLSCEMNSMEPDLEQTNNRILIIDDNPAIHDDFRRVLGGPQHDRLEAIEADEAALFGLERTGARQVVFEIDSAFQGAEGLEKVRAAATEGRPYAMAFVDVRMPPGWDGIETILNIWKEFPDVQMVICTAYSDYSWDQIAEAVGSTDSVLILKKPFDSVEVLQIAHALTRKWQLSVEARRHVNELDELVSQRTAELREANEKLKREIGERTAVEEALRRSEERFSKAFQASPLPMCIQNSETGAFVDVNTSYQTLVGYDSHGTAGSGVRSNDTLGRPGNSEPNSSGFRPPSYRAWLARQPPHAARRNTRNSGIRRAIRLGRRTAHSLDPAGHHGKIPARESTASGPEDGSRRPARRGDRSRFQQPPNCHPR